MMDELEFLRALRDLPLHGGARNLEDDCAVVEIGSQTLVITHDMMAEGTHYRPEADMANVAWKLVAVNLSDLAGKGARPLGALLGASLGCDEARFISGLQEALAIYDMPLLGGDTISATGTSTFGLTAIGTATHLPVPGRDGAQIGDAIYITGTIGCALLGFEGHPQHIDAFERPQPRLAQGQALAPIVHAMMDVSDGLMLDGWRMAKASGVTFRLNPDLVPVADPDRFEDCVRWGDDYELLFTAAPDAVLPVPVTRIGTVEQKGAAPICLGGTEFADPASLGYRHG